MLNILRVMLLALLFLTATKSFSEDFLRSQPEQTQKLNEVLYFLDDPEGTFTIEEVSSGVPGEFQPLVKPNYGFGFKGVRWVRFKIDLSTEHGRQWFLQQNYTHVQNWTVFYAEDGKFKSINVSEDLHVDSKPYSIPNFVVKLPLPGNGVVTYYARYEPRGHALNVDLVKMSERGMVEHLHLYTLTTGLFFGAIFVLILYNLFLCLMLRSRVYAYYVYYLVFFALAFIYLTGYAPLLVGQMSVMWEQVFAACSFAGIHGMTLSGRSILNLKTALPRTEKVFWLCEGALLLGVVGSFFVPVGVHYAILNPLILCSTLILLYASIYRSIQGYTPARIYAVGWISFILLMMCYSLTFIGLLPLNWFTANAVKVAAVLEATLFSIALALRFKLGAEMSAKAKNAFLGMVSHELKTPLQTIVSCLDIISADGGVVRDQSTFKRLNSAAKQLETQVGDLTDFAHLESGHLKLRLSNFSPPELLRDIEIQHQKIALEKQLVLTTELIEDQFLVHADALRFKQIASNLVENAIKYTKQGFVTVRLARSTDAKHPVLVLEVEDSGIGIAPEHIQSIYQPFVQVDQSLQRKYRGIGMGLTIVKNLVSLMGGYIEVDSTLNKGTVFTVTVPYQIVALEAVSAAQPKSAPETAKKLLLVDDEPEALELLGQIIQSMGHEITCSPSGRDALLRARVEQYDAILLDVNMPDLDGINVAKRLRKFKAYETTPIVWISATRPAQAEKDDAAVFSHFLEKPIHADALKSLLTRI
jgi:signal transduction histidine kinase/CheY-like chemotaxis protein